MFRVLCGSLWLYVGWGKRLVGEGKRLFGHIDPHKYNKCVPVGGCMCACMHHASCARDMFQNMWIDVSYVDHFFSPSCFGDRDCVHIDPHKPVNTLKLAIPIWITDRQVTHHAGFYPLPIWVFRTARPMCLQAMRVGGCALPHPSRRFQNS